MKFAWHIGYLSFKNVVVVVCPFEVGVMKIRWMKSNSNIGSVVKETTLTNQLNAKHTTIFGLLRTLISSWNQPNPFRSTSTRCNSSLWKCDSLWIYWEIHWWPWEASWKLPLTAGVRCKWCRSGGVGIYSGPLGQGFKELSDWWSWFLKSGFPMAGTVASVDDG